MSLENSLSKFSKWSKWAQGVFKKDKPLGSEAWFNPEDVTSEKRAWLEQHELGARPVTWPDHIYEKFAVVGLPPDIDLTHVAEQLCNVERRRPAGASTAAGAAGEEHGDDHGDAPQPAFEPQVLYSHPEGYVAPISDREVAALCFPHGVAPERLTRTPSMSGLDDVVFGRHGGDEERCFVFQLKAAGNFPLYGACWYVTEMLHRPPAVARARYPSCAAAFRQCMIAAPRCYCLLSHYPFFDLHFKVLKIVVSLERLERLLEYDLERQQLQGARDALSPEPNTTSDLLAEDSGSSNNSGIGPLPFGSSPTRLALGAAAANGELTAGSHSSAAGSRRASAAQDSAPWPPQQQQQQLGRRASKQALLEGGGGPSSCNGSSKQLLAADKQQEQQREEVEEVGGVGPTKAVAAAAPKEAAAPTSGATQQHQHQQQDAGQPQPQSQQQQQQEKQLEHQQQQQQQEEEQQQQQSQLVLRHSPSVRRAISSVSSMSGEEQLLGAGAVAGPPVPRYCRECARIIGEMYPAADMHRSAAQQQQLLQALLQQQQLRHQQQQRESESGQLASSSPSTPMAAAGPPSAPPAAAAAAAAASDPPLPPPAAAVERAARHNSSGVEEVGCSSDGGAAAAAGSGGLHRQLSRRISKMLHRANSRPACEVCGKSIGLRDSMDAGSSSTAGGASSAPCTPTTPASAAAAARGFGGAPVGANGVQLAVADALAVPMPGTGAVPAAAGSRGDGDTAAAAGQPQGGFDAAAAAFDGAAPSAEGDRWAWRDMMTVIRTASHKLLSEGSFTAGGDPGASSGEGGGLGGQPSLMQQMWSTWAPTSVGGGGGGSSGGAIEAPMLSALMQGLPLLRRGSKLPLHLLPTAPATSQGQAGEAAATSSPKRLTRGSDVTQSGEFANPRPEVDQPTTAAAAAAAGAEPGSMPEVPRLPLVLAHKLLTTLERSLARGDSSLANSITQGMWLPPPPTEQQALDRLPSLLLPPPPSEAQWPQPRAALPPKRPASVEPQAGSSESPQQLLWRPGAAEPQADRSESPQQQLLWRPGTAEPQEDRPESPQQQVLWRPGAAESQQGPSESPQQQPRVTEPAPEASVQEPAVRPLPRDSSEQPQAPAVQSLTSAHSEQPQSQTLGRQQSYRQRVLRGTTSGSLDYSQLQKQEPPPEIVQQLQEEQQQEQQREQQQQGQPDRQQQQQPQQGKLRTQQQGSTQDSHQQRQQGRQQPAAQQQQKGQEARQKPPVPRSATSSAAAPAATAAASTAPTQPTAATAAASTAPTQPTAAASTPPTAAPAAAPEQGPSSTNSSRKAIQLADGSSSSSTDRIVSAFAALASSTAFHGPATAEGQGLEGGDAGLAAPPPPARCETPQHLGRARSSEPGQKAQRSANSSPKRASSSRVGGGGGGSSPLRMRRAASHELPGSIRASDMGQANHVGSGNGAMGVAAYAPLRASSTRKSLIFEGISRRHSSELGVAVTSTISHMVHCDSSTVLSAYWASGVPQPGEMYSLNVGDLYRLEFLRSLPTEATMPPGRARHQNDLLAFSEAECAEQLQLWTVAALCRSLSLDNILTFLNAALLEKQVVVFCPNIGTLAAVVLALVPLLRPFTWQSLLLPVTPLSMLGFLEAPVPFVLGCQYKTPEVVARCHHLIRVNVYKDAVKHSSMPALPNQKKLAAALAPYHQVMRGGGDLASERPIHQVGPEEEEAALGFLQMLHGYLSTLTGDLRLHTIVNVGMSKRTGLLMKDSLIDSAQPKDRPFLRAFLETQMFAVYSDGVISDYCEE